MLPAGTATRNYCIALMAKPIVQEYTSTQDVVRSVYKELNDEQIIKLKEIDEDWFFFREAVNVDTTYFNMKWRT